MDATVDYKPFFLHRRRGFFDFFFLVFCSPHSLSTATTSQGWVCSRDPFPREKKKLSGAESHSHHHCSRNVVVGKNKQRGSVRIIISSFSRELLPLFLRKKPTRKGTKKNHTTTETILLTDRLDLLSFRVFTWWKYLPPSPKQKKKPTKPTNQATN